MEPNLVIWYAKFQVDISIFCKHTAQKLYSLMTPFFKTAILSISRHRTEIKMIFLESWDQTGSEPSIFINKNLNLNIWPYMTRGFPDPSLPLTCMESDCKMASIFEFYVQKWPEIMCRLPKKEFLISVTLRDLSWPDLDANPYLVWHLCSQGVFNSPLLRLLWLSFEQELSIFPAQGFIIQKCQNLTFDLTLTRNLRSVLKP